MSYAVLGGNAVSLWMEQYGEGGERFTPNRDFLINRADLPRVANALMNVGFAGDAEKPDVLRDGVNSSPRIWATCWMSA